MRSKDLSPYKIDHIIGVAAAQQKLRQENLRLYEWMGFDALALDQQTALFAAIRFFDLTGLPPYIPDTAFSSAVDNSTFLPVDMLVEPLTWVRICSRIARMVDGNQARRDVVRERILRLMALLADQAGLRRQSTAA